MPNPTAADLAKGIEVINDKCDTQEIIDKFPAAIQGDWREATAVFNFRIKAGFRLTNSANMHVVNFHKWLVIEVLESPAAKSKGRNRRITG